MSKPAYRGRDIIIVHVGANNTSAKNLQSDLSESRPKRMCPGDTGGSLSTCTEYEEGNLTSAGQSDRAGWRIPAVPPYDSIDWTPRRPLSQLSETPSRGITIAPVEQNDQG